MLPIGFMQLIPSDTSVSLLVYAGASFETDPSYYTIYELLPNEFKFGSPSMLRVRNCRVICIITYKKNRVTLDTIALLSVAVLSHKMVYHLCY